MNAKIGEMRKAIIGVLLLAGTFTSALSIQYCSSENTGVGSNTLTDPYQSNGLCHDNCLAQYAFAVVQGSNCWCSNYAPFDITSPTLCGQDCPGFPAEKCGNITAGLYGYIALSVQPSGTQGAPSSSSSLAATSTVQVTVPVSPSSVTVLATVTAPPSVQTTTVSIQAPPVVQTTIVSIEASPSVQTSFVSVQISPFILFSTVDVTISTVTKTSIIPFATSTVATATVLSLTSTSATTTSISLSLTPTTSSTSYFTSTPTAAPTSTIALSTTSNTLPTTLQISTTSWTPIPYASVTTVTDGVILTVTLTPTAPPPARTSVTEIDGKRSFWATTAHVVPTFVCIGLIVIVTVAGSLWYCHRNSRNSMIDSPILPNTTSAAASRPISMISKLGEALGVAGINRAKSNRSFTVNRNSTHLSTSGMEMTHTADRSATNTIAPITRSGRRDTDDRLDPSAFLVFGDDDDGASTRSFHDERDYSRRILQDGRSGSRPTLRVRNPDNDEGA